MKNNAKIIIFGLFIIGIFLTTVKGSKPNIYLNESGQNIEVNYRDDIYDTSNIYGSLEKISESPKTVSSLKISNTVINDPESISKYKNIEYLNIYECEINDFSFLRSLDNLKSLEISYSKSNDFSRIKYLQNKERLLSLEIAYCKNDNGSPVTDIDWLKDFTGLTFLSLCGNDIKNFDVISNMKNLEILYLYDNDSISTLEPLYELPNLTSVIIPSTYVYTDEDTNHLGNPMESAIYYD